MDKLTPVFRAPQADPVADDVAVDPAADDVAAALPEQRTGSRRACPSRRQRRFERRLAERKAAAERLGA